MKLKPKKLPGSQVVLEKTISGGPAILSEKKNIYGKKKFF